MSILNKLFPHFVGIDIGSASIKVVEVSRFGKKVSLRNYAHLESATYEGQPFRAFEKETLFLAGERSVEAIKSCFEAAGIQPQKAIFSLPDFSSFFVTFDLPAMSSGELAKVVNFHASKYVPIPMTEIVLDWKKVGPPASKSDKNKPLHILAVAIPKKTMQQYRKVAESVGVSNFVLEPEAFSLFRVFIPEDDQPLCVIDFGSRSTTLSFGDRYGLQSSHSLDVAREKIVKNISEKLNLEPAAAQELLDQKGFEASEEEVIHALTNAMSSLVSAFNESWRSLRLREVVPDQRPRVLLAGGTTRIPGLQDYIQGALKTKVEVAKPFTKLDYPSILEPAVQDIGPAFSVAVGAALRNF